MIIIATYLGAVVVVAAARTKLATEIQSGIVRWKYLSPVLSAWRAFAKVVITQRA